MKNFVSKYLNSDYSKLKLVENSIPITVEEYQYGEKINIPFVSNDIYKYEEDLYAIINYIYLNFYVPLV
jgi:hypothetical protein